jgi:flavin reductase (DIM6/NTAB) family NADH-FMN oxidoreductase RutF
MSDRSRDGAEAPFSEHSPHETDAFKALARRWAATVTVLTGRRRDDAGPAALDGFTATAFLTVSIDPPIVLVSATQQSSAGALVRECDHFTVNLLSDGQRSIAERFAMPLESRGDAFATIEHELDPRGAAVIAGSLGAFSGSVRSLIDAGDHVLLLLDVSHIRVAREERSPLLYLDRAFRRAGDKL